MRQALEKVLQPRTEHLFTFFKKPRWSYILRGAAKVKEWPPAWSSDSQQIISPDSSNSEELPNGETCSLQLCAPRPAEEKMQKEAPSHFPRTRWASGTEYGWHLEEVGWSLSGDTCSDTGIRWKGGLMESCEFLPALRISKWTE